MTKRTVIFDIETDQFGPQFKAAENHDERRLHAPRMRVACTLTVPGNRYRYFTPEEAPLLVQLLKCADRVVSFNGLGFDVLVLERHHGLDGKVPTLGEHVDLHAILTDRAGFRVALDAAVRINLGERKHTNGRAMDSLDLEELKIACRSDVSQTYRLWKLHTEGQLQAPAGFPRAWGSRSGSEFIGGPGSFMPQLCPHCHDVGSMVFVDWDGDDDDDLTEGQFAEYMAGTQGSAQCQACGFMDNWTV